DRMAKKWDAPIYVFFKPTATIEYVGRRKAHVFKCATVHCCCKSKLIWQFLYSSDAGSTSNMHWHAKFCWGSDTVAAADMTGNIQTAREALLKQKHSKDGTITAAFEWVGKGKIMYSQRAHTNLEAHAKFVCWVTENKRPFQIVNDRAFQSLMKMGRLESYIPCAETISCDVKKAFIDARGHIATMLQEYDGKLSFATDAWTSPNQKAYVAITVHLECDGKPLSTLLDVVEVPKSHSSA
ncbi:hypothetical protein EI94DRAFT_1554650, partial [Lactarius quietus]